MKYSKLFGKTTKGKIDAGVFVSNDLLVRAGFIRESVAGRYFMLPLGWRVHDKIKSIIKEEMDKAGAQEMISPVLHPLELWKETNRTNTTGFELMKVTDRRGAEFALGGTAEEMFVDVVRKFQLSYRDLPFNIYQFSTKFRDELRARGGLLRVREFVMKDAYSFHTDETDFKNEYESMANTYTRIFERIGLATLKVEADNGYIGGEYCHEFQVEHELGEGRFFVSEDGQYLAHEDVAEFELEPVNPDEEEKPLEIIKQPEWVQTMDDNTKHYSKDKRFFLKNVVYKTTQGDMVIATVRGDLEVNKTKLEQVLDLVGQLTEAEENDLAAIGTRPGYVHSWGHKYLKGNKKVIYVADNSLKTVKNFIGGQKEIDTDTINVNYGRDFKHEIEGDIVMAQDGFISKNGHGKLMEKRGIEVGNIFQLGHHYTNLMTGATFTDKDGRVKPYYMGCYGIGLGRTMAAVVEKHHDERGIVWPRLIAPFDAVLINLKKDATAAEIYDKLKQAGIDVLHDDRDVSAGEKFADADLIGIPARLVISEKTGDKVELKERTSSQTKLMSLEEIVSYFGSR